MCACLASPWVVTLHPPDLGKGSVFLSLQGTLLKKSLFLNWWNFPKYSSTTLLWCLATNDARGGAVTNALWPVSELVGKRFDLSLFLTLRSPLWWWIFIDNLTGWNNHLEDIPLGISVKMFPEKFNWGGKTHPKCGRHHPMGSCLTLSKREKEKVS